MRDYFVRHIYHISPSCLLLYLKKLCYSSSAKLSSMKEAESMVSQLVLKNKSQKCLQIIFRAHSPLGSQSSSGGWSMWVQAFLSPCQHNPLCPMLFNFFLMHLLTQAPHSSLPDQCMVYSLGFWTKSPSQTKDEPSPRLSLWSSSNLSFSTPSLPGFPSRSLCQAHESPPRCPQWHSSLLRSASHFPGLQLLISLLSLSLSAPFLSTWIAQLPPLLLPWADRGRGIWGAKAKCSEFRVPPSLAWCSGKPPSQGKPSSSAGRQVGLLGAVTVHQLLALRASDLLGAAAAFKALAGIYLLKVFNEQARGNISSPISYNFTDFHGGFT